MHHLRRVALVFGCMSVFVSPLAHAGSFIIELTNGREIITSHVWEEGDEIKFDVSQGTAGVPKTLVKRIRTSNLVHHDKVSQRVLAPSAPDPQASTTDGPSATSGHHGVEARQERGQGSSHQKTHEKSEARLQEADAQLYRKKKLMLTDKLDQATNKHFEGSAAKNPDSKKAALDDMREYSKQILDLGDEVKNKNGGLLPPWWNE